MKDRFFAVDTMAVLYRSHFAMIRSPIINSRGINVSGLNGLLHTLLRILEREKPAYLAVATDSPQPTFRHERYPEYKATREKMPEELVEQLPYIPRIVNALHLPYIALPGFEADDIIGTLVEQAGARGLESYMVTGDKDFMQLVGEHAFMYSARGDQVKLVDIEGVRERFGCAPSQVIEVLGLMGDASDNVPGVRGVGEKTAVKLVRQFQRLEQLYEGLDKVKGEKLKENLATHKETAFLSRELVTIKRDVPLELDFEELAVRPATLKDNTALIELLTELEFQMIRDRLLKSSGAAKPAGEKSGADYQTLDSLELIRKWLPRWEKAELLVLDTETTGLDYFADSIIGISFSIRAGEAQYIPLNSPRLEGKRDQVLELLRPLLESPLPPKGGHNLKFDLHMLLSEGIEVGGVAHDTMISSHLTEPMERRHDLDSVALRRLGLRKTPITELIGKGKGQITMDLVDIPTVSKYASEDAEVTFRLHDALLPRLERMEQKGVFDQLEMPLVPVLVRVERAGIRFDQEGSARISAEMEHKLAGIRERIHELAGESEFNINSIVELQRVLYEKLKLHEQLGVRPKKIKTGMGLSTDEETLTKMASHPLPRTLLEYRELTKLKSTYLDQLGSFIRPSTGKIHTSFRQTAAATGRLASDKPNLQNIPVRSEEGRKVRALFLPTSDEYLLLSADYSQIELRVVADYSGDPTFMEAYRNDVDIHALTGAAIFGVDAGEVDRSMRSVAKEVNFGLIYRMGADRLAQVTQRSKEEARDFITRFFEKYDSIRAMQEELMERARKEGYATTRLGRRRYLAEINSPSPFPARLAEGMAINTPIQGTAAEIIKLAMIAIDRRLGQGEYRSKMVLTIHDELVFDAHRDEIEELSQLVTEEMENAMTLAVPLKVDIGTGDNWLEAH